MKRLHVFVSILALFVLSAAVVGSHGTKQKDVKCENTISKADHEFEFVFEYVPAFELSLSNVIPIVNHTKGEVKMLKSVTPSCRGPDVNRLLIS